MPFGVRGCTSFAHAGTQSGCQPFRFGVSKAAGMQQRKHEKYESKIIFIDKNTGCLYQ